MKYFNKSGMKRVFVAVAIIAFLTAAWITIIGLNDQINQSDVAIVPGSKVEADGKPSARLAARLDKAAEIYANGIVHHIFVSGGRGKEGYDEGTVMHDYLLKHNVPETAIVVDNNGNDTLATIKNGIQYMYGEEWKRAIIVSQFFHIERLRFTMRSLDKEIAIGHARANFFEARDVYSLSREVLAYWAYLIRVPADKLINSDHCSFYNPC